MKLKVTQENLNKALNLVARVADSHSTLPVLANVLLRAEKNRLSISATNLEIGITHFVGAKIEKEGVITIPANLFSSYISSLPSSVVSLELEDNKLKIDTDQYNSTINGINAEDFPVMPAIDKGESFTMDAGVLRKGLSQVVFAAATSDSRPVLTGVYLHTEEGKLLMVATDSSRLAEKEIGATKKEIKLLVPATSMHELQRVLDEQIETVGVVMDEQQAMFKIGDTELVSRLINSNYPAYRAIIPKEQSIKAIVKRSDLLNITKVSSLFARETAGSITIEVDEDQKNIHIRALASQLGENSSMADAKVTGSGSVTLNSKFLIDALNAMSGEDVEFSFNSKIEPVLIKDPKNKDYIHVIMPLKA